MSKKGRPVRRQIFVFTSQEKKAAACVVGALVLGLATKFFRENNPQHPPKPSARQEYQQKRSDKRARAYARSARGQREAAAKINATPVVSPMATVAEPAEDDE